MTPLPNTAFNSHHAGGQTASECSLEALSDAAVEQLEIYDKGLYLEPNCANGFTPMPVHCNYMGLGQECRGCFESCDGAMKYMDDWPQEIDVWVRSCVLCWCRQRGRGRHRVLLQGTYRFTYVASYWPVHT